MKESIQPARVGYKASRSPGGLFLKGSHKKMRKVLLVRFCDLSSLFLYCFPPKLSSPFLHPPPKRKKISPFSFLLQLGIHSLNGRDTFPFLATTNVYESKRVTIYGDGDKLHSTYLRAHIVTNADTGAQVAWPHKCQGSSHQWILSCCSEEFQLQGYQQSTLGL